MENLQITIIVMVLFVFANLPVYAGWNNPVEVVSGKWGESTSHFGREKDEVDGYKVSEKFCVTNKGYIAVADGFNFRVKIYKDKSLTKIINYVGEEFVESPWPQSIWCSDNNIILVHGYDISILNTNGKLKNTLRSDKAIFKVSDKYIVFGSGRNYSIYNSNGEFIKDSNTMPKETGVLEKAKIQFADATFARSVDFYEHDYKRDKHNRINVIHHKANVNNDGWHYMVCKYDKSGKSIGCIEMPQSEIIDKENTPLIINKVVYEPIISSNGDVYAAITTPNNYKILKWQWTE